MDLEKARSTQLGLLIGLIICTMIAKATESGFFLVLTAVMLIGCVVSGYFIRCPHCGHNLSQHHWHIDFCPYCGGCL